MDLSNLKFDAQGLIPAIVQDYYTNEVLTLAYMNRESLEITLKEDTVFSVLLANSGKTDDELIADMESMAGRAGNDYERKRIQEGIEALRRVFN